MKNSGCAERRDPNINACAQGSSIWFAWPLGQPAWKPSKPASGKAPGTERGTAVERGEELRFGVMGGSLNSTYEIAEARKRFRGGPEEVGLHVLWAQDSNLKAVRVHRCCCARHSMCSEPSGPRQGLSDGHWADVSGELFGDLRWPHPSWKHLPSCWRRNKKGLRVGTRG